MNQNKRRAPRAAGRSRLPSGFRVVPRIKRSWLLATTTFAAASVLVGAGVMVVTPTAVLADPGCTGDVNAPTCSGTTPDGTPVSPITLNSFTAAFTVELGTDTHSLKLVTDTGTSFTVDAKNEDGAITLTNTTGVGSKIVNYSGNGFVLHDAGQTASGVVVNVNDLTEGGSEATVGFGSVGDEDYVARDYEAGDGFRATSGNGVLTFNIGETGTIQGADDGLVVLSSTGLEVNNSGNVIGRGLSTDASNDSEGILVSSTGNFGGRIAGPVTINNYGAISGASRIDGNSNPGGQGISVSSQGEIDISNYADGSITGAGGIIADSAAGVYIDNHGHIGGTVDAPATKAGIEVTNADWVETYNDSYQSVLGTDGQYFHDISGSVYVDNEGGLTAGLTRAGINIQNVTNDDLEYPAVEIDNADKGIVAGNLSGIYINGVHSSGEASADVVIDNAGYVDESIPHSGGLILGNTRDGINIRHVDGDVTIYNAGTNELAGLAGLNLDNAVYGEGLLLGSEDHYLGIWGAEDGIHAYGVGGQVNIQNGAGEGVSGGLIVGMDGDAVNIGYVDDGALINNEDGIMAGYEDGVRGKRIQGGFTLDNQNGLIIGGHHGVDVSLRGTGDADIENAGGVIVGFNSDAIQIDHSGHGHGQAVVSIYNGDEEAGNGGVIIGDRSAIDIESHRANVGNGVGGLIMGDGSYWHPVIDLDTSHRNDGGGYVENYGVISSLPNGFSEEELGSIGFESEVGVDPSTIAPALSAMVTPMFTTAASDYAAFSRSGGQTGAISADDIEVGALASGVIVGSEGGAVDIENHGIMVGRVNLDGHTANEDDEWSDVIGNNIVNYGTWLTANGGEEQQYGNQIHGSQHDQIQNVGLIQTAFDGSSLQTTSFEGVNDFWNGSIGAGAEDRSYSAGLVSMIDGGEGDLTEISDNFHGSTGTATSLIGIDVKFGPDANEDPGLLTPSEYEPWRSDRLYIDGNVDGSTGLIINKLASDPTNATGETILVVRANSVDEGVDCGTAACKDGNAFYVAPQSKGYLNVGGVGAIQDGAYAWYLRQGGDDPDFVLTSDWAPQADQLPSVITGAQNIWHDTSSQVEDHIYDEHFAGEGGAGADMAAGETPAGPYRAGAGGHVWGKIGGSQTNRDTSVDQTIAGISTTIDTGLVQNTFSLLAGADYAPTGEASGVKLGIFGGYLSSNLGFSSYGASASYTGGTIGGYVSYTSADGLYVDGEAKVDLLNLTYTAPFGAGFSTSGLATSAGLQANAGYRLALGNSFVEPIGSLAYVNTTLQDFSAGAASVSFANGQSLRAGAGVRIGTTVPTGKDMTTELALLGKVWNEFEPANNVTISDTAGDSTTFADNISGVFGEVAASATLTSADRGFSGFVSVSDKFNGNFNTVSAKAGLSKAF